MVTVPAFVWRYGPLIRGVILGVAAGTFFGVLAWLDSGFLVTGLIVFVMLGVFYGLWMSRRMARHWPTAKQLTGPQREQVARAARGGERIDDPDLMPALTGYRNGLHEAAQESRFLRWLVWFVLTVSVGMALWDAAFGSWGNAIVSAIYLVLLALEVFWWPTRQRQLLANADMAVAMAREESA
jgi:hypothetical protein